MTFESLLLPGAVTLLGIGSLANMISLALTDRRLEAARERIAALEAKLQAKLRAPISPEEEAEIRRVFTPSLAMSVFGLPLPASPRRPARPHPPEPDA